jgi:hypothetical protein
VAKPNKRDSARTPAKSRRSLKNPKESQRILSNRDAVEDVISWLYSKDALGKVHSATVAIVRSLATRLDDPEDASNARLWKEYREAVDALIKAGEERSNEFDDVLRGLEASLRDTPAR